jgi:hypothetical protein
MLVTKVPVTSVVTKEKPYRAWACGSHQWALWVLVSKTVVSSVVSKEGPAAHAPARVFGASARTRETTLRTHQPNFPQQYARATRICAPVRARAHEPMTMNNLLQRVHPRRAGD